MLKSKRNQGKREDFGAVKMETKKYSQVKTVGTTFKYGRRF
jgi:hypothetical protein